jgi:hypothetical protein
MPGCKGSPGVRSPYVRSGELCSNRNSGAARTSGLFRGFDEVPEKNRPAEAHEEGQGTRIAILLHSTTRGGRIRVANPSVKLPGTRVADICWHSGILRDGEVATWQLREILALGKPAALRLITVNRKWSVNPRDDFASTWFVNTPRSRVMLGELSADVARPLIRASSIPVRTNPCEGRFVRS